MDKEEAKALKKKLKAEAKIAKAKAKAESEKPPPPPPEKKKKSWRDNVVLYTIVALFIGILLWVVTYLLDYFFVA